MKIKSRTIIQYILIYLLIILQGALFYRLDANKFEIITTIFCIVIIIKYNIKIEFKVYAVIFIILFFITLTFLTKGGVGITKFIELLSRFLVVYTAYYINREEFLNRLVNLIVFFASISLIFYVFSMISPQLVIKILSNKISYEFGGEIISSYGKFLYVYREIGSLRNNGIFSEPGIYQIVLVSAIFIILFKNEQLKFSLKKKEKKLLILIVTLFTTMSTSGYLSLLVIILGYLFTKQNMLKKRVIIIFGIGMVFILGNYVYKGNESILNTTVIQKVFDKDSKSINLYESTGSDRLKAIEFAIECVKKNPLGIGYNNYYSKLYSKFNSKEVCNPALALTLAALGIQTTLIILYWYLSNEYKNKQNVIEFLVFVFILFSNIMAQSYILNTMIMVIAVIKKENKSCFNEERI